MQQRLRHIINTLQPSQTHTHTHIHTRVPAQALPVGANTVAVLRVSAAVAGHDKDINTVAVAPNDSLVATGEQWRRVQTLL